MITLVGCASEVECVILMVAGTGAAGCYMVIEMIPGVSSLHWEASLTEPDCRETSHKEFSLREASQKNSATG